MKLTSIHSRWDTNKVVNYQDRFEVCFYEFLEDCKKNKDIWAYLYDEEDGKLLAEYKMNNKEPVFRYVSLNY